MHTKRWSTGHGPSISKPELYRGPDRSSDDTRSQDEETWGAGWEDSWCLHADESSSETDRGWGGGTAKLNVAVHCCELVSLPPPHSSPPPSPPLSVPPTPLSMEGYRKAVIVWAVFWGGCNTDGGVNASKVMSLLIRWLISMAPIKHYWGPDH